MAPMAHLKSLVKWRNTTKWRKTEECEKISLDSRTLCCQFCLLTIKMHFLAHNGVSFAMRQVSGNINFHV